MKVGDKVRLTFAVQRVWCRTVATPNRWYQSDLISRFGKGKVGVVKDIETRNGINELGYYIETDWAYVVFPNSNYDRTKSDGACYKVESLEIVEEGT